MCYNGHGDSMYTIVRDSIVDPGRLIKHKNDRLWRVFLYVLVFAALMSTNTLIDRVILFKGTSFAMRNAIIETAVVPETNCNIVAAMLVCDEAIHHTFIDYTNIRLVLDSHPNFNPAEHTGFGYHLVLNQDKVYLIFMGRIAHERSIASLDSAVHTLSFNYDDATKDATFNALFSALDRELLELKPIWGPTLVFWSVVNAIFIFNVFIFLNTFLTRVRVRNVPFREMYVMMTYAATLLYVVMIFETMLPIPFLLFIVLLFVAFRQMSKLALELQKRQIPPQ